MIIKNNSETQTQNLIYLTALANQTATNGNVTLYNPTTEIAQSWNHTTRGLTDAGTAIVAIGAAVVVVATAGSGASLLAVAATASASAAASTAAVSATNASMNADGDLFKQIKTINVTAYKDTTSEESLKNIAIAGVTAALTVGIAQGVSSLSSAGGAGGAGAGGAGGVGGAGASVDVTSMQISQNNTSLVFNAPASTFAPSSIASGANTVNALNTINTTATITERFSTAIMQSGINGISQAAAQSAINGDSFTQALKNQGVNLLINAIGQVGATEIATSAKAGNISNATHIAATTTLGCAMAVAGGNNCAAGAASSLVGAIIGGFSSQNPDIINKQQSTAIAQLVGAVTAAAIVGPDGGNSVFAASQIAQTTQNVYSEIGVLFTPEEKNQIDQALIGGNLSKAQELVNQFSQGKNLTENQKEKLANLFEGNVSESEFLADLTPEDKEQILLVDEKTKKPTSIGIFFEGTDNDRYRDAFNLTDPSKNIESNVARLSDLYNGRAIYLTGVGSSGGLDTLCQGTGCGASGKQNYASKQILEYYNPENPKLLVIDKVGASRGGPIARDFGNKLITNGVLDSQGNQAIPPQFIILRSELLFDSVASFGISGNGIDWGKDFSIPKNTIAIQAVAADEGRNHFDLQSIKFSDGTLANPNWIEQSFAGAHSDILGSYAQGYQGKNNDIQ